MLPAKKVKHRFNTRLLRAGRIVRKHAMLGVSGVALAVAGAGAAGTFDSQEVGTVAVSDVPGASAPAVGLQVAPSPMTITYVLVGSEEERYAWDSYEDSMKQRGFLSRHAVEVMVVETPEEATAVSQLIDEQRARNPWNEYVVDDRR